MLVKYSKYSRRKNPTIVLFINDVEYRLGLNQQPCDSPTKSAASATAELVDILVFRFGHLTKLHWSGL